MCVRPRQRWLGGLGRRDGRGRRQFLRFWERRWIKRLVGGRLGSGSHGAITHFSLIDIDEFLERRAVFPGHRQPILKRMLLLNRLSCFLLPLGEALFGLFAFVVSLVLGLA